MTEAALVILAVGATSSMLAVIGAYMQIGDLKTRIAGLEEHGIRITLKDQQLETVSSVSATESQQKESEKDV